MAKTNEENGAVVSVDTLSNLFADKLNLMVMQVGPNNTETEVGTLHYVFVPRSYVDADGNTVDMVANYGVYQRWIASNWNGKRSKFSGLSEADKIALASDPKAAGFEPSEAYVQSPVELAIQNILVRLNPEAFKGLTPGQIASVPETQKAIAVILNDPARTEKYRDRIEAEMQAILATEEKRSRKGKASKGVDLDY